MLKGLKRLKSKSISNDLPIEYSKIFSSKSSRRLAFLHAQLRKDKTLGERKLNNLYIPTRYWKDIDRLGSFNPSMENNIRLFSTFREDLIIRKEEILRGVDKE